MKINRRMDKEMKRLGITRHKVPLSMVSCRLLWLMVERNGRLDKRSNSNG